MTNPTEPSRWHRGGAAPLLDRRSLLVAGTGALLLAACGGSRSGAAGSSASGAVSGDFQIVQFFKSGTVPAGVAHRLAFGLGDTNGVLQAGGPDTLDVTIANADGAVVQPTMSVARHARGLARPYWPVTVTLPAGTYQAQFQSNGKPVGSAALFQVSATTPVPKAGDRLPVAATPTPAATQGVTPICTRDPVCPLHDVSLDTVLGRQPVALLVGTPAYCQTAICGPTLDVLLANQREGVAFIHAEVWKDNTFAEAAPVLGALGLDYEPVLFTVRGDGTVADRLDVIFDADDITTALAKIV